MTYVSTESGEVQISIVCNADAAGWHIPAAQDDPDLKTLIESWSGLPIEIRAGIMLISSPYRSHFASDGGGECGAAVCSAYERMLMRKDREAKDSHGGILL